MKKYKYVVVAGCSYSLDPSHGKLIEVGKSYGGVIADHFEAKCYNLAKHGGSFQRMNRKILGWCGENKDKFRDTLIIIGMTRLERFEFWNNKTMGWYKEGISLSYHSIPAGTKGWFSQKNDYIDWTVRKRVKWYQNFFNDNAQFLLATNTIIGLQSFLTLYNIDHVFFNALESMDEYWETWCDDKEDKLGYKLLFDSLVSQENWYKHPEYKSMVDFIQKNLDMRVSLEDGHPNKEAHKYWAECLLEYINEKV